MTAAEFQGLAAVPAEAEWFANIDNPRTRRAYQVDIREFMRFVGIGRPEQFRIVTRAHVLAWRKDLEGQDLSVTTIRRKLAALSLLFEQLCDANAVTHNPVKGVKRPTTDLLSVETKGSSITRQPTMTVKTKGESNLTSAEASGFVLGNPLATPNSGLIGTDRNRETTIIRE